MRDTNLRRKWKLAFFITQIPGQCWLSEIWGWDAEEDSEIIGIGLLGESQDLKADFLSSKYVLIVLFVLTSFHSSINFVLFSWAPFDVTLFLPHVGALMPALRLIGGLVGRAFNRRLPHAAQSSPNMGGRSPHQVLFQHTCSKSGSRTSFKSHVSSPLLL